MKFPDPREHSFRLPDFDKDGFELDDGEEYHRLAPETFWIPDLAARRSMSLGDHAKLIFSIAVDGAAEGERMWVIVRERTETGYVGMLDNDAFEANGDKRLLAGAELRFELRHVIGIEPGNEKTIAMARAPVPTPWQD